MMHESHRGKPCSYCGACPCHVPEQAAQPCEPTGYLPFAQFIETHL